MAAMDRDIRIGGVVFLLGLATVWLSFTMPMRGDFIESPGIFPGMMGCLLVLFGALLTLRAWRKGGRFNVVPWARSVVPFLTGPEHRSILLGILLPAVYVFAGIPLLGFYPSTALFMAVMFYLFVKRWRRWAIFLPIALALTGLLYLIFNVLFQLEIR